MGLFFYNVFLQLFNAGIHVAAFFNKKAEKWVKGRRGIWDQLQLQITSTNGQAKQPVIWMHCASLGEFEQGRPLLEDLRKQFPDHRLLLTFFSPSGYEIRKEYKGVDWVFYLPRDGKRNAQRFLDIVNPGLVIFVKYEFWYHYLHTIHQRQIPLLLVSALFQKESVFFKWYGGLQRRMLGFFTKLFVQNDESKKLLDPIGFSATTTVAGDTRFDRVIAIAESAAPIEAIEKFVSGSKVIVAGSTWPKDEQLLHETMKMLNVQQPVKLIIAPHEIGAGHIDQLQALFPNAVLYSQLSGSSGIDAPVLIIDNIGMLSRLYRYATISYIGGGFGAGIHNTLEAAVYGAPVLFGPNHQRFKEAIDLLQNGGAFSVNDADQSASAITDLLNDELKYSRSCENARRYVYDNRGATQKIIGFIQENRLLTN